MGFGTARRSRLGEEQKKFEAIVGSPSAEDAHEEFQTNYSESQENSFRLGVTAKGKETQADCDRGAMTGRAEAEATYRASSPGLQRTAARIGGLLPKLSQPDGECGAARRTTAKGVRLVESQPGAGDGDESISWDGIGGGISHIGREPAAGIRVVLRARFVLDFAGIERGRRFCEHEDGAGIYQ